MVALDTPQMPDQSHTQTYLVRGTLNGPLAKEMMIGPFIVAFAVQVLGYSNAQITWFLSLTPLFVLLRYPFLDRIRQLPRIKVVLWSRYIQIACMVALLVLPQDWLTLPMLILLAVLFVFGNEFLQNAVWMNLVTEVSDTHSRGRFLGRLRTWKQVASIGFFLLGFFIVGQHMSHGEHKILLLIVTALLLNSVLWYARVPSTPPPSVQQKFAGNRQFWTILKTHPLMRRPLVLTFVITLLRWPILIVYIVGTLHLPANLLMLMTAASMLGAVCSEYIWGSIADKHGIRRVFVMFFLGTAAISPLMLLWPDYAAVDMGSLAWIIGTSALLFYHFATGILVAGELMAMSMYRAQYLSDEKGFHAYNILTASHQLFVAGLTALGGVVLIYLTDLSLSPAFDWVNDPFRAVTLTTMIITSGIGIWLTLGIARRKNPT